MISWSLYVRHDQSCALGFVAQVVCASYSRAKWLSMHDKEV